MLSHHLNLLLVTMGFSLMLFGMPNEGRAGKVETFLRQFSEAQTKMMSKYDQVHISAVITEVIHGKKREYNVEMFQDGNLFKIAEDTGSGNQVSEREIIVANPVKSFVLMKTPVEKALSLRFLGSPGKDYERARDDVLREAMLLRAPFNYFEMPLREFLSMPETSIQDIKEETVAGKQLMRVMLRTKALTEYLQQKGVDRLEGWLLFDPQLYWALQSFEIKQLKENSVVHLHIKETLDYGDAIDGMPILRSVRREVFDGKGYRGRAEEALIKSVIFGPTPGEEFTLKGCGFAELTEGDGIRWLPTLLWSAAIAFLALILIRILHRRNTRKLQGAG